MCMLHVPHFNFLTSRVMCSELLYKHHAIVMYSIPKSSVIMWWTCEWVIIIPVAFSYWNDIIGLGKYATFVEVMLL
jgi:hypothetical protein